jgi:hypothetical protein
MDLTNLTSEAQHSRLWDAIESTPSDSDIIYAVTILIDYIDGMQKGLLPVGDREDEHEICMQVLTHLLQQYAPNYS